MGLRASGPSHQRVCRVASLCLCEERICGSVLKFAPALSACRCTVLRPWRCSLRAASGSVPASHLFSCALANAEHGCPCSRAKASSAPRGFIGSSANLLSPSRAESQDGSPQLSSSAVQASIVSGVAVVCLQALPNCCSHIQFFAVTCKLAACQMPVGLQQGRMRPLPNQRPPG